MDISKYRFYVGTARGALLYTGDKPNDVKISKCDEGSEVTVISEGRNSEEIILGYQDGKANIFNTEKNLFTGKIDNLEGDESITGIGCIKKSVILARRDGVVNIWKTKKNDYFSTHLDEKGTLDVMARNQNRDNIIGTGGEHNDFKLWDVETKQCIFKSKSLGHDELQLPIPTSIRGISFFSNEPNLGACCTKEGHILLYDDRAQRKPIVKFIEKKASYTSISTAYRDRQVMVGTTKGYMQWLDLKAIKCLKTYSTFTGSVTSIVCDPIEPFVASVSLDRYLRVHHLETKEVVYKCYMKQNLTKLFVKPIIKDEEPETQSAMVNVQIQGNETAYVVDEEYEDIFNNMEEVRDGETIKKPKRKSSIKEMGGKKVKKKKKVGE